MQAPPDTATTERIAVIGTGATALGVLHALRAAERPCEITLFDIDAHIAEPPRIDEDDPKRVADFYNDVYRALWKEAPRTFPPPKTHFADPVPKQDVGQGMRIFRSNAVGGLTNYWGATLLPFVQQEMTRWPIDRDRLDPYYRSMAELVGITGEDDPLRQYLGEDYATRPAFHTIPAVRRLNDAVNASPTTEPSPYKVVSGLNRCALETRDGHANSCTACGECMAGCYRNAVYSTRRTIRAWINDGSISRFVAGRVHRLRLNRRTVDVEQNGVVESMGPYSRIFLCAGCPGSTEIMLRSCGIESEVTMTDNAVYVFPIVDLALTTPRAADDRYFGLCNLIFGCAPEDHNKHLAQVQVYPNFDYLWRYNCPPVAWPAAKPLLRYSRRRLLWGRLYLHSDLSQAYAMRLAGDSIALSPARIPDADDEVRSILSSIRAALRGSSFFIPPVKPVKQKSNSHYGGTLAYRQEPLNLPADNEVASGIYLCDSSCFPDSPATSPTFTMMANACRIAKEAVA